MSKSTYGKKTPELLRLMQINAELLAALEGCAEACALPDTPKNLSRKTTAMIRACATIAKASQ